MPGFRLLGGVALKEKPVTGVGALGFPLSQPPDSFLVEGREASRPALLVEVVKPREPAPPRLLLPLRRVANLRGSSVCHP